MIKGNFYPSVTTIPLTGNKFTDKLETLSMPRASDAYWLGWLGEENTSSVFNVSALELTTDSIIFKRINRKENHNIGYLSQRDVNSPSVTGLYNVFVYPTSPCTIKPAQNLAKYINRLDVKGSGNSVTTTSLLLDFVIGWKVDGASQGLSYFKSVGFTGIRKFLAAMNGDETVTVDWSVNGTTFSKEINLPDLENDGFIHFDEYIDSTHVDVIITICSFMLGYSQADKNSDNNSAGISNVLPVIDLHIDGEKYVVGIAGTSDRQIVPATGRYTSASSGYGFCSINCSTGQWIRPNWESANYYGTGKLVNGAECVIPKALVNSPDGFYTFGNCLVWKRYTNQLDICRMYKPSDIYKLMGIQLRYQTSTTGAGATIYGYVEDNGTNPRASWAPHVSEENEFLAELITGDSSDTEFRSQLRDWQIDSDSWELNDYVEAELPPYVPSDEEQMSGIDILPNRSYEIGTADGFISMYGLNSAQIGRFGQYLWADFFDEDFLDSIGVIFGESLSLNPSDILNYIVSLRCFPFSLFNVPTATSIADTIYIGRGIKGIELNSGRNVLKISSYSFDLYGGITKDPDTGESTISPYYGDFRDYESCSRVTVFVPFFGSLELNPSQVVGNSIILRYSIDLSTGSAMCCVSIRGNKEYVAGTLSGVMGATVEMSASNLSQTIQSIASFGVKAATTIALIGEGASASSQLSAPTDAEAVSQIKTTENYYKKAFQSVGNNIASVAGLSASTPPSLGTTSGFASFQMTTPFVRVEYLHYEVPSNYAHVCGYACNKTVKLGTLKNKGFTVCQNVDLEGIPATQEELALVEQLLQSGVYF